MDDLSLHHRHRHHGESGAQWALLTPPTQEPITLVEAKQHARITQDNDDATIDRFIRASREEAEDYMARGLLTQTWQLTLPHWADEIFLPRAAPLQNDPNASPPTAPIVQYYDVNGALQTAATTLYLVDTISRPGRIARAPSQTWPTLQPDRHTGRVLITYVVGWTDVSLIPERIKQGLRMYVTFLDCDRDGLEQNGDKARARAESCWNDRVTFIEPICHRSYPWLP